MMIEVGQVIPDFMLTSHEREEISISQYRGKWVVLHTFPFAFTGGWTSQTSSFNRALNAFEEKNTQLLGLSIDTRPALSNWANSLGGIRHPLLSDFWPHGKVLDSLGILNHESGNARRALLIIDPEGIVRHVELHQGTLPNPDDTLATLNTLQS